MAPTQRSNRGVSTISSDDEDSESGATVRQNIPGTLDGEPVAPVVFKPWYRRPSPWWVMVLMPISAMSLAAVAAPHVAIMTDVICRQLRQETLADGAVSRLMPFADPTITSLAPDSCASDPKVQAAVSKLIATLTAIVGILSCITTPSWASLSDRWGRLPVLAIANLGSSFYYFSVIFVTFFADGIPGGLWALTFSAMVFGLFGGTAAATASVQAYIADCTPRAARARTFSLTLGLRFIGMAVGPTIGGLLMRITPSHSPRIVLYLVAIINAAYAAAVLTVVPESLSPATKAENRRTREQSRREERSRWAADESGGLQDASLGLKLKQTTLEVLNKAFAFVKPLSVVAPIHVVEDATSPSRTSHTDWSLTLIATAAGLASLILSSYPTTFQYTGATFHWNAEQQSYWFSLIVAARAITVTVAVPVIINVYHRFNSRNVDDSPSSNLSTSSTNDSDRTPLLTSTDEGHARDIIVQDHQPERNPKKQQQQHSPKFDLVIAQLSLILEIVCYALVPVFRSRPTFIVFTVLAACGAGFGPAIQSLAVELYSNRGGTETGKLFGVLGVVQSISSQIVGPTLYGFTYVQVVSFYPEAIFFVSAGAVACATVALLFVELPKRRHDHDHV